MLKSLKKCVASMPRAAKALFNKLNIFQNFTKKSKSYNDLTEGGSGSQKKQPIAIARESPNVQKSHLFELADECDIIESITNYAHKRQRGVWILSGTGKVANVTLRQPGSPGAVVTLAGKFEIISLSGSFLPSPAPPVASGLSVHLSGGQGQVIGGTVIGPLMTSGSVIIMAATFGNLAYERLPLDLDDEEDTEATDLDDEEDTEARAAGGELKDDGDDILQGLLPNKLNSLRPEAI